MHKNYWFSKNKINHFKYQKVKKSSSFSLILLNISLLTTFLLILSSFDIYIYIYDTNSFGFIRKGKNQRIFDTWMYNNEAEMAYIRLWRLYDYVDYFIILISNTTFSGLQKRITFHPFQNEIKRFEDKMRIVYVPGNYTYKEFYGDYSAAWEHENSQRDYAINYIEQNMQPTEDDIILVSDCDEIFTRDAVLFISEHPPKCYYYVLGSMYFPYYFHYQEDWTPGFVLRYRYNMTETLSEIRSAGYEETPFLYRSDFDFITHCSWCFKSIRQYKNKLLSFSHQEFNKPPYTTPNFIFKSQYCRIKINSEKKNHYDKNITDYSQYLPTDDKRLQFLVDKSFTYNIKETTYTENDLKTLCPVEYDRTPFHFTK